MRFLFITPILMLGFLPLHAQQIEFHSPDPLIHGPMTTDIRSSPGIVGDRYYVVYRDFGTQWDLRYNVDTYIKVYSLKGGSLLKTIYLNPLVSPDKKKQALVDRVILWKRHLFVLYSSKEPAGADFPLCGQLLDLKGRKVGDPVDFGYFPSGRQYATAPGQYGLADRGRNGAVPLDGFRCSFNSDSSRMALFTLTRDSARPVRFVLINPDLQITAKIDCNLAVDPKAFRLLAFRQYHDQTLYALIREDPSGDRQTAAFALFAIDPEDGDAEKIPVGLPGKIILDANFAFDDEGKVVITGTYCDEPERGRITATQGVFTMAVAGDTHEVIRSASYAFAPGLLQQLGGSKAAAGSAGIGEIILIRNIFPLPGNRLAVMGQSHKNATPALGKPRAMNPYFDEYGNVLCYEIGPSGKVTWTNGVKRSSVNLVLTTNNGPVFFDTITGEVQVFYDAEKKESRYQPTIYQEIYHDDGTRVSRSVPLTDRRERKREILWTTAQRVSAHQIVAAYYDPSKAEMGTVGIQVP